MGFIIDDADTDEYILIDDESEEEYYEVQDSDLDPDELSEEDSEESEDSDESEEDMPDTKPEGYSPEFVGAYCDECQEYHENAKPNTVEGNYICRDCKRSYRLRNRYELDY